MDSRNPKRFRFVLYYFIFVSGLIVCLVVTLTSEEYRWALVAYLSLTFILLALAGLWSGAKWLINHFFRRRVGLARAK